MKQIKNFFKKIWPSLKPLVIDQLRSAFVKAAVKRVVGTAIGGGFLGAVAKFLAEEFFEDILEPLIRAGFVSIGYTYHRYEGNILITRVRKAREENNVKDYNVVVDDIFS